MSIRIPAGLLGLCLLVPTAQAEAPSAPDVVAAIEAAFGVTPGQRRNHIKGSCAVGEFVGNPQMQTWSRSPLFSGATIPVVGRFSLSGGNPKAPDTARSGRGMALQFRLPQGQIQHMTMLNTPMFGAAVPQTFLDLMQALRPDPQTGKPDPEKMKAFKATHPDSLAQAAFLASNNPPASYASSAYWGIHTFRFLAADGKVTPVRWRFVPLDGEQRLSDEALKTAGSDFLEQTLIARTQQGPARWEMRVSIGQPGDPDTDPTQPWPADRPEVLAGTLSILLAMPQRGAECEAINFDPLRMADGIEPTDDPILHFRSPAYAVSFAKRLGGL